MLKHSKKILIGSIIATLMLSSTALAWSSYTKNIPVRFAQIKLFVNDKMINTDAEPFIYNENVYVPAATIANALGIKQVWDHQTPSVRFTDIDAKLEYPENPNFLSIDNPIGNGFHLWWNPGFKFTFEDRVNGFKLPIPIPEELTGHSEGQVMIESSYHNNVVSKHAFYMLHHGNNHVYLQLLQYETGNLVSMGVVRVADHPNDVIGLFNDGRNTVNIEHYTKGELTRIAVYRWDDETKKIKMVTELKPVEG